MANRRNYTNEAGKLARTIELAINSLKKYPPQGWSENQLAHVIHTYVGWKQNALHPAPQYKRLSSLNYLIQDAMTLFQEGSGNAVECFWEQVTEEQLGYERIDKLQKILGRGKLNNQVEFDYVTDVFIAAEQEGRITKGETSRLSQMLGAFEKQKTR